MAEQSLKADIDPCGGGLTLQFSGGTMSCVISPPWTQKMCFISPVKMSQTMTEKSTPPDTSERWS